MANKMPFYEYRLQTASSFDPLAKELFETAFPEEERPPFEVMMSFDKAPFFAVYVENVFIGIEVVVEYQDMVYLFFLAIQKELRGQGHGGRLLSEFKKRYAGKRLFLLMDEVSPEYPDYDIRVKRERFYRDNGFIGTKRFVREYGVVYEVLCHEKTVSPDEFIAVMAYVLGEERFREYEAEVL